MSSPLPQPFRFHLQEHLHPFPQNESISFLRRKRKCATTVITSHIKHVVYHYVNAISSVVTKKFSNNTKQNHQNNDNYNVIPIFNDKIISYHFRFVRWIFPNVGDQCDQTVNTQHTTFHLNHVWYRSTTLLHRPFSLERKTNSRSSCSTHYFSLQISTRSISPKTPQ